MNTEELDFRFTNHRVSRISIKDIIYMVLKLPSKAVAKGILEKTFIKAVSVNTLPKHTEA